MADNKETVADPHGRVTVSQYHAPFPFLLVLVVAAAVEFRRLRKGDGLRLVLTLAVAFVLGVIAIDRTLGSALDYRLRWTWMPGMFGFLIVTWFAALALTKRWPDATRRVVPVVVVIGLVVLFVVNVTTALRAGTPQRVDGDVVEALLPTILDDLARDPNSRHGQVVVDDGPVLLALSYSRAMVLQLERRGDHAWMPQPFGVIVGQHRQEDDGPVAEHLVFAMDWEIVQRDADPGLHQVAKWSSATPEQERTYHEQAAKIDEAFANGQMSELDHVIALKRIDLGELDPATAWAVAVYRADPQLSG